MQGHHATFNGSSPLNIPKNASMIMTATQFGKRRTTSHRKLRRVVLRFAIYHREREYAREMGDPKLAEIDAESKAEAERLTAHMGMTGTWAVQL